MLCLKASDYCRVSVVEVNSLLNGLVLFPMLFSSISQEVIAIHAEVFLNEPVLLLSCRKATSVHFLLDFDVV